MGYGIPVAVAARIIEPYYGRKRSVLNVAGDALQRAQTHIESTSLPALIELRYDPDLITPNITLQSIRESAQQSHSR